MDPKRPKPRSLPEIVRQRIASGQVDLPIFDETASRMQQMISRREFDVGAVEKLVQSDPALTGGVLRLSNSSFFGGIDKVLTVRDAIVRLGVKQVAKLVVLSRQRQQHQLRDPALRVVVGNLWRHSVGCALGCDWLARRLKLEQLEQQAFTAGLLHDVGKLLLLRVLDDLQAARSRPVELQETLVQQLLDGLHSEHGSALMQSWNVPGVYAQIARDHERPDFDERDTLLALVRLVDRACRRLGIGTRGREELEVITSPEAQALKVSEVIGAELEIALEDALQLAD